MASDKTLDFLVIGQGLAGSLLAWFLLEKGRKVLVADPGSTISSTMTGAGLIHPVTGRRIVKTWEADVFIPFARNTYLRLQDRLGASFFEEYPVLELFHDHGHRNDWAARSAEPGMQHYIGEECPSEEIPSGIRSTVGGRWVLQSAWLDMPRFATAMRRFLQIRNALIEERVLLEEIEKDSAGIRWRDYHFQAVIDCTGASALQDPLLRNLMFNPCKGEILRIRTTGIPQDSVIHGQVKIIPEGGNTFIAGATYDFKNIDGQCTEEGLQWLREGIEKTISVPYEVVSHKAAIRPSTRDRKPLLGPLDTDGRIQVFNGLGSKGALLGPWMAAHLSRSLTENHALHPELQALRKAN